MLASDLFDFALSSSAELASGPTVSDPSTSEREGASGGDEVYTKGVGE